MKVQSRNKNGYALVTILVIGVFSIMFLVALAGMLMSLMQSEAVSRQKSGLFNSCEIGLDYALNQMNTATMNSTGSSFDLSAGVSEVIVSLPPEYLSDSLTQVKIKVRKLDDTTRETANTFSLLYCPQLEPLNGVSPTSVYAKPVKSIVGTERTRIVEVTASKGIFSNSIRTVLTPKLPAAGNSLQLGLPSNQLNPVFPSAGIFAVSELKINPQGGDVTIQGTVAPQSTAKTDTGGNSYYDFNLSIKSNKNFSANAASGSIRINGNVEISNNATGAPNNIVQMNSSSGNQVNINGRLLTNNSSNSSVEAPTGSSFPSESDSANVNALADHSDFSNDTDVTQRSSVNDTTPSVNNADLDPVEVSPVPSTSNQPVDTDSDGFGDTTNDLSSFLNQVSNNKYDDPGSNIVLSHGQDLNGNEASSFTSKALFTDNKATVTIDPSNSEATQIYIDGANSAEPVNIDATKFVNNGDPSKLQIYYDGPGNVTINVDNGTFNGLVYAPNSTIQVVGNGTFNGALVGNKADLKMTGTMNLIPDLGDVSGGNGGGGVPALPLSVAGDPSSIAISGFRASTFQHVNGKIVE